MHNNISFTTTDGTTLRGWHYTPNGSGKHPTIVIAHGFSAVKEMYLDRYAEAFAQAGFASVVYDNRNFGASDGEPARRSIHGSRSETFLTLLPLRRAWIKLIQRALGCGGRATAAHTCASRVSHNRQAGKIRRLAGARDQRVTGLSTTGACRLHRPSRSATPEGPCQPRRRWRPCDASRGGGRYPSGHRRCRPPIPTRERARPLPLGHRHGATR